MQNIIEVQINTMLSIVWSFIFFGVRRKTNEDIPSVKDFTNVAIKQYCFRTMNILRGVCVCKYYK